MQENLHRLTVGAERYFKDRNESSVTFDLLVGTDPSDPFNYVKSFEPVAQESYTGLVIKQGQPIKLTLPDGAVISYGP